MERSRVGWESVTCSPREGQSQKGKAEGYENNSSSRLRLKPPNQDYLLFFWEAGLFYLLGEPTGADQGSLLTVCWVGSQVCGRLCGASQPCEPLLLFSPPEPRFTAPLVFLSHLTLVCAALLCFTRPREWL